MAVDLPTELTSIRRAILTMGATVEQRLSRAMVALLDGDIRAAQAVQHGDKEINEMEIDIEAECLRVLALTHPVARDLRFVFTVLRINNDLERMADLVASIARRAIDIHQNNRAIQVPKSLTAMGSSAQAMVGDTLLALADGDVRLAQHVRTADDVVDDLLREVFAWVQTRLPLHPEHTALLIEFLSVARKLERIADLSTNIAENVIYLTDGRIVRHEVRIGSTSHA